MESKERIVLQHLVRVKIKGVCCLVGRVRILRVLNRIVFDSEDILYQAQVGPPMVKHCL